MVGGFHASDGFSVLMEPPSQIILPDTNYPILYNETSHLLVFLYFYLTNKVLLLLLHFF